jgi:hypothetical protein
MNMLVKGKEFNITRRKLDEYVSGRQEIHHNTIHSRHISILTTRLKLTR